MAQSTIQSIDNYHWGDCWKSIEARGWEIFSWQGIILYEYMYGTLATEVAHHHHDWLTESPPCRDTSRATRTSTHYCAQTSWYSSDSAFLGGRVIGHASTRTLNYDIYSYMLFYSSRVPVPYSYCARPNSKWRYRITLADPKSIIQKPWHLPDLTRCQKVSGYDETFGTGGRRRLRVNWHR